MRDRLEQVLLAAARLNKPGDQVPHAFELRILAAIRHRASVDPWLAWNRVFCRAAVLCVAISMISGVWFYCEMRPNSELPDLEHTVFAALDHPGVAW